MKLTHFILLALVSLLASCSSGRLVTESDTGRTYPAEYLDSLRGMASGQRDAEQMRFAADVLAQAGQATTEHGVRYPGTGKQISWTHRGQPKFTALRLGILPNGMEMWQGPNPASGFYSNPLTTTYWH